MVFNPEYEIGQIVSNNDLVNTFACATMGGMRRSHTTNTLVLVSDYTKGLYQDKWIGGVLHYTGTGKRGNQVLEKQNETLANSGHNGVDIHLFQVLERAKYIYCGKVMLVEKPYTEIQSDERGIDRTVWMFPVKPVPENDVIKPKGLVFKNMDDYKANGKNADSEYNIRHNVKNKSITYNLKHKTYGLGTVTKLEEDTLYVIFEGNDKRTLTYSYCIENNLIEFID